MELVVVFVLTYPQGLLTFVIGVLAFGLMPASPTQTAHWFRGKKGWFTERLVIVSQVLPKKKKKKKKKKNHLPFLTHDLTTAGKKLL
jgi:hypothetical protein